MSGIKKHYNGTYSTFNDPVKVASDSPNFLNAMKELSSACKLTGVTENEIQALNLTEEQHEQVVQLVKNALNEAWVASCTRIEHFIE